MVRIETTNISSTFVECTFYQPGYTCTIDYGTDPSHTNLVYRDTSSTQGQTATITLSQRLITGTTYYYSVSAVTDSQCVRVQGRFQIGRWVGEYLEREKKITSKWQKTGLIHIWLSSLRGSCVSNRGAPTPAGTSMFTM